MHIQEASVHCTVCRHEWLAEMIVDAPVEVATASMLSGRCPKCGAGARKVAFGRGDVPDPQPVQAGMMDAEKRAVWLKMHDNGLSSECLAEVMCGLAPRGNYPHDGDDFGRCERLLILYPEWRARLGEMRQVNDCWAALVENWDKIVAEWRHDVELSRKPKAQRSGWRCYPL